MRILVDTNVIMDYLADRKPFSEEAYKIMELCTAKTIEGCIASHTITNLFYILRKDIPSDKRRNVLLKICKIFTVVGIDLAKLELALKNDNIEDFEDCLQMECAKDFNALYIVTRNIKDYKNSSIQPMEPKDFLITVANGK